MLDIEQPGALVEYLRAAGHVDAGDSPRVEVLAGGVSNRTVMVRLGDGREWVVKQALERLRTQAEWHSDPARIHREAAGLRWLGSLGEPVLVPEVVFEDHQHHLLGMTAVPTPHENLKTVLMTRGPTERLGADLAELLSSIHFAGWNQSRTAAVEFEDRGFFETLRLEPYYSYSASQVPEAAGFLRLLISECRKQRLSVVHGDFSSKNLLLSGRRLYLLDHEVIHFGDPAFDVGFMLTHLLSKAHHLPDRRGRMAEVAAEFHRVYSECMKPAPWFRAMQPRIVRHTLACLLARVAGRSPLEYLSPAERSLQQRVVLGLMVRELTDATDLIHEFMSTLSYAQD